MSCVCSSQRQIPFWDVGTFAAWAAIGCWTWGEQMEEWEMSDLSCFWYWTKSKCTGREYTCLMGVLSGRNLSEAKKWTNGCMNDGGTGRVGNTRDDCNTCNLHALSQGLDWKTRWWYGWKVYEAGMNKRKLEGKREHDLPSGWQEVACRQKRCRALLCCKMYACWHAVHNMHLWAGILSLHVGRGFCSCHQMK